ncbi:hypothetical protein L0663_16955 [Dyadobacter sp. CY107]|uniref:hypothetical protein n=1 Tax=Dyadobacter fanqingshengii TaxID=2906443 RepID=UPI001F2B232D|nr:hypothetical protein [Dyadobacter fanqingshengii]MCF2505088.1 hypothetical protein [Dyadobacter fanqingshengii]
MLSKNPRSKKRVEPEAGELYLMVARHGHYLLPITAVANEQLPIPSNIWIRDFDNNSIVLSKIFFRMNVGETGLYLLLYKRQGKIFSKAAYSKASTMTFVQTTF